jgi:hypothetical protein
MSNVWLQSFTNENARRGEEMIIGSVTGRQYVRTRMRGYASWDPKPQTFDIIKRVGEIIAEYAQELTIRQIFYRLVGKYSYEKTERAYDKLGEYLNRARRAGLLQMESFRDDGDIVPSIPGWKSPQQFWNTVRALADEYYRTPDGLHYVELWVETAGMVPQIQAVANPFGVRVTASGGFSSLTARYNAAKRLMDIGGRKPVTILLIGDFDPSGQSIMDSSSGDVVAFGAEASFERLAVTPEQAEEYNLESAPQKEDDRRGEHMPETYQAEALDPDVLAGIVRERLLELIGDKNIAAAEKLGQREQVEILAAVGRARRSKSRRK